MKYSLALEKTKAVEEKTPASLCVLELGANEAESEALAPRGDWSDTPK